MNLSERLEKAKRERLALREREQLVLGRLTEPTTANPSQAPAPTDLREPLAMRRPPAPSNQEVAEPIRLDDYRPVDLSDFDANLNPSSRAADFTLDDWMIKAQRHERLREQRLRGLYELITQERDERFTIDLTGEGPESTVAPEPVIYLDAAPSAPADVEALPRRTRIDREPVQREIDPRFEQYARRNVRPLADLETATYEPATYEPQPQPQEEPMNRYATRTAPQPAPMMRRRGRKHARKMRNAAPKPAQHLCPQCGAIARVDIHDPFRGRLHLSCNACFKMWQKEIEPTYATTEESYLLRY